jgi:hypothetical protein
LEDILKLGRGRTKGNAMMPVFTEIKHKTSMSGQFVNTAGQRLCAISYLNSRLANVTFILFSIFLCYDQNCMPTAKILPFYNATFLRNMQYVFNACFHFYNEDKFLLGIFTQGNVHYDCS